MTRKQVLDSAEVARLAGYASFKDLGEPNSKVLDRLAEEGAFKVMNVGFRKFYPKDIAATLLAERRAAVPPGFVSASDYAKKKGYQHSYGPAACRRGVIKSARQLIVNGKRPKWFALQSDLDAFFDRDKTHAKGAAAAVAKGPKSPAIVVGEPVRKAVVANSAIERLEKIAADLANTASRLESILGTTSPVEKKTADLVIEAPFESRIR